MYDAKKIIDIANALVKGYNRHYDRFLDERCAEWAKQVEARFRREPIGLDRDDSAAQRRLQLLKHIISENEKYCRRNIEIPTLEFEEQMTRIEELNDLRIQAGKTDPHPTILSEKASLLMLKGNYRSAQNELELAISINERHEDSLIAKRDNVRFLGDYVRCLYMQKAFDSAIEKADQSRRLASQISIDTEKAEWEKYAAAPGLQFMPVAVHAYFAACDARINHERWHDDEQLQREFTGLWSDAVTKHNVPRVWRTPMKIAVASDKMWVSRTESYVQDIAEQLYIELAGNAAGKMIRLVRSKWGGFRIDYPKTAAAAVALIAFFTVPDVKTLIHPSALPQEKLEIILRESGISADVGALKAAVDAFLPSNTHITVEEFVQRKFKSEEFETIPNNNQIFNIASSGSESNVQDI